MTQWIIFDDNILLLFVIFCDCNVDSTPTNGYLDCIRVELHEMLIHNDLYTFDLMCASWSYQMQMELVSRVWSSLVQFLLFGSKMCIPSSCWASFIIRCFFFFFFFATALANDCLSYLNRCDNWHNFTWEGCTGAIVDMYLWFLRYISWKHISRCQIIVPHLKWMVK